MDGEVVDLTPGAHKRSRESDSFIEKAPDKKLCGLCGNVNISTFLEDAAEVDDIFLQSTLDEAHEKLVSGVMKSLEEELGTSYVISPSHQGDEIECQGESVDFSSFSALREETCFSDEYSFPSNGPPSISSAGELESFELRQLLDNVCEYDEKMSTVTDQASTPGPISTVDAGSEKRLDGDGEPSEKNNKSLDLGYLLEASDNELGIALGPNSRSFLQKTDISGSDNAENREPWRRDWDYIIENLFESVNDDLSIPDLFRRAIPSLEVFMEPPVMSMHMYTDPSVREYPSFEAAAPYLESAGASH